MSEGVQRVFSAGLILDRVGSINAQLSELKSEREELLSRLVGAGCIWSWGGGTQTGRIVGSNSDQLRVYNFYTGKKYWVHHSHVTWARF